MSETFETSSEQDMLQFPYTIEYRDGQGGTGTGRAFKIYPLQEGQREPLLDLASDEEVLSWHAYQAQAESYRVTNGLFAETQKELLEKTQQLEHVKEELANIAKPDPVPVPHSEPEPTNNKPKSKSGR